MAVVSPRSAGTLGAAGWGRACLPCYAACFIPAFLSSSAYIWLRLILAILIASDIARSFIDPHCIPGSEKQSAPVFISHAVLCG